MRECQTFQEVLKVNTGMGSIHIFDRVAMEHLELEKSGVNEDIVQQVTCERHKQWKKPEPGQIKLNVDGAWLASSRKAAIRVIARDHQGMMLDGCARLLEGAHSSKTVESSAFEIGVSMAVANGWENVVIEGDAITVVNRLSSERPDCKVAGSFLTKTRAMLCENLGFVVRHVAREANRVAHELVNHSLSYSSDYFFLMM
ncbi:hypothetical protein V6N11_060375 [Hibiscus sabdariffa]|uniref:RNase H type-1 domain-containing protein n=1 Tax=Hibiscus sabdariffa TaxID=183260 RepID=A0ABR2QQE4_9ROSI